MEACGEHAHEPRNNSINMYYITSLEDAVVLQIQSGWIIKGHLIIYKSRVMLLKPHSHITFTYPLAQALVGYLCQIKVLESFGNENLNSELIIHYVAKSISQ